MDRNFLTKVRFQKSRDACALALTCESTALDPNA
jgi:hypothetical protein